MALLSRSSLRGSVRQTSDHSDDGLAPKKLRAQENESHRPRSSPDCLDTSVLQSHADSDKARLASPPLKSTRPRTSTRRTRRSSTDSVYSVASSRQLIKQATPHAIANGIPDGSRGRPKQETPSGAASADFLIDDRESPDPLDTISPAVNSPTKAPSDTVSAAKTESKPTNTPVATRATRRSDPKPKTETTDIANEETKGADQLASTCPTDTPRSLRTRQTDPPETEQPVPPQGSERRSLRSADTGSRCKSELAPYFHNYEQLISLEAPKPELLAAGTAIVLVDDLSESLLSSPDQMPFGNPLQKLHNCEVISLPEPVLRSAAVDPLNDELYFRVHRRFERQEKQLRNIERERAQHEKQNVDRLLDELRSQDWLRIMGLTGVHESEKKLYEPKRQILIQELDAVLNKFQVWKDEEKRRKLAKDKPHPAGDAEAEPGRPLKRPRPAEDAGDGDGSPVSGIDTPSTPDPNDVDAWAARQLHQEARSASAANPRKSVSGTHKAHVERDDACRSKEIQGASKRPKIQQSQHLAPAVFYYEPYPNKPFTSFFEDREARDAALAGTTGAWNGPKSNALAFGHPIPEMEERDFEPPPELLTEEYIQSSRRQRRRLNRKSQG